MSGLSWIPAPWIYAVSGVLLTALSGLGGLVIKRILQGIKQDWDDAMDKLSKIENVTAIQAENHLQTIQSEAVKQTALLTGMVNAQAETNGYLKAVVDFAKK